MPRNFTPSDLDDLRSQEPSRPSGSSGREREQTDQVRQPSNRVHNRQHGQSLDPYWTGPRRTDSRAVFHARERDYRLRESEVRTLVEPADTVKELDAQLAGVYWEWSKKKRKFVISCGVTGTILYYPRPPLRGNRCKRKNFWPSLPHLGRRK